MSLIVLGGVLCLLGVVCALFIVVHAFRLSTGTGMMVLFIPGYILFYGFSQFEHRYKGPILAGFYGLLPLGCVLVALGLTGANAAAAQQLKLQF